MVGCLQRDGIVTLGLSCPFSHLSEGWMSAHSGLDGKWTSGPSDFLNKKYRAARTLVMMTVLRVKDMILSWSKLQHGAQA